MGTQGSSRMTDSNRGPAQGEAYGVAGFTQHLQGVSFPVSKEQLIREYGQEKFQWTKGGKTLTLRECLQKIPQQQFDSITEITAAVSDYAGQS